MRPARRVDKSLTAAELARLAHDFAVWVTGPDGGLEEPQINGTRSRFPVVRSFVDMILLYMTAALAVLLGQGARGKGVSLATISVSVQSAV